MRAHDQQRMVLLMVVRVVHQDVEHHAAEQLTRVPLVDAVPRLPDATKQSRQLGIAHLRFHAGGCGRTNGRSRGHAVNASTVPSVEAPDGDRAGPSQRNDPRLGHRDARTRGQRHRRVLDQGRVDRLPAVELDHPLFAADVDERLRLRTAQRTATAGDEPRLDRAERFGALDLRHHLAERLDVVQARQWATRPGFIRGRRRRHPERAESVVAGVVQELHQRQAFGPVGESDDLLAPAVRPRVIDGADRTLAVARQPAGWQELDVPERQILAQCEAVSQPGSAISQRHALAVRDQPERAHIRRRRRVAQIPEMQVVPAHVTPRPAMNAGDPAPQPARVRGRVRPPHGRPVPGRRGRVRGMRDCPARRRAG